MLALIAADGVLLLHLAFIAFVVLGALLAFRWRAVLLAHIPAAAWGAFIEFSGGTCPLTSIENALRARAGASGYAGGFVEHYLVALIYPDGLTRDVQWLLGSIVLAINAALYGWLAHRAHTARNIEVRPR